jgi:hypothetical protein
MQSPSAVSPMTTYSISHFSPVSPADARSPPPLPPSVQANLLSVGMRVRKSVPEGYKTGTYSAFALFSDPTPAKQTQEPTIRKPISRPRARELAPFCGIMKVGGLAQQQSLWEVFDPETDSAIVEDDEEDDGVPALSQGSTNSDISVASSGIGKRRFDFDDEDEMLGEREVVSVSGRRIIAVPRRKGAVKLSGAVEVVGQENMDADVDFGEADFLDYGLIDEVEMAGV